jgi:Fe-S cluster assembly scaffold protein SufB
MMNMNNEEFDRKMAFIVEQQAQFASDIQQLQDSQARTDQVVAQTAEVVGQMGDVVTRLATVTHAGFTEVNAKINALVDAQIRTEENLALTQENLMRTDKNVASTDESLRKLIAVVDRYLGSRNGK